MNFKNNLISVIIPIYNREKYIKECLESVFNQSYQDFEIIIVDDGSTDNSYLICEEAAKNDRRIKLYKSNHCGVSAARNIALDNSTGEYVFFLDSDDVIHPALFATLVDGMKTHKAHISGSLVANVSDKNWHKLQEKLENATLDIGEYEFHDSQSTINSATTISTPLGCIGGVMMRNDLIGETRFSTQLYIGEDFYFIYENLIKNATSVFLKPKWYFARIHENNTSWDYSFDGFFTRFLRRKLVWESEERFGRTNNAAIQKKGAFGCYMRCAARNKIYSKDCKKMRKVLKENKKALLPALTFKSKIVFLICIYLPASGITFYKFKNKNK